MGSRLGVACVLFAALGGCYRANGFQPCAISCSANELCPDDSPCGPDGLCHAGTPACPGGPADARPDTPLPDDGEPPIDSALGDGRPSSDGSLDATPPDASMDACVFGTYIQHCFTPMELQTTQVLSGKIVSDVCSTGTLMNQSGGGLVCAIFANQIQVPADLLLVQSGIFGSSVPVALVAFDSITVMNATIDASSADTTASPQLGAGANFAGCADAAAGAVGTGSAAGFNGGAAGGAFGGAGGTGGSGFLDIVAGAPAQTASVAGFPVLRGGCPGGHDSTDGGSSGGGAVYLLAGNLIELDSATIQAGGAGGPTIQGNGGTGGASGGMIVLEAPVMTGTGTTLYASGGGGGAGGLGMVGTSGAAGTDARSPMQALGGGEASVSDEHAGGGGAGSLAADGQPGQPQPGLGGGGGGGGGAGVILELGTSATYANIPNARNSSGPSSFRR